jgi:transposase
VSEVSTIGLDIAKQVFQAHGADASGNALFRKRLTRAKALEFFRSQPRCLLWKPAAARITGYARS